jgi:hypothetical protein
LDEERDVVRRLTIELVEDAACVRIDVTSPKRVDLVLREVHTGFAERNPDVEARWLGAAEAFVRGDEGSRERTHPDSLFQATVSAPRRSAPWDVVELRVSVPVTSPAPSRVTATSTWRPRARRVDCSPHSQNRRRFGCAGSPKGSNSSTGSRRSTATTGGRLWRATRRGPTKNATSATRRCSPAATPL